MLRCWQCPLDKLWHVPLVPNVWNLNMDRILFDHPLGHSSLHTMYEVANMTLTRQHINAISLLAHCREYFHNVYKLPSLEPIVRYLHAATGFPPKLTWLKAVQWGNYSTWPLINRGSSTRFVKFSNGPDIISRWSNLLYSLTMWYPESLKKNDHNLPVGPVKCDICVLGGCSFGFFVGFWLVLGLYALAC